MALRDALRFIEALRGDPDLSRRVAALPAHGALEDVVEIADAAGFHVTTSELRAAYGHDWAMRQARYRGPSGPG